MIRIATHGVDTQALMDEINLAIKRKAETGAYAAAGLDRDVMHDSLVFRNYAEFLDFYFETLREAAFVDIADFEITEKRKHFARPLIMLKKAVWAMLRFYTFRLWSQQNQINGLLLAAIEGLHEQHNAKVKALEARIDALETRFGETPSSRI